MKQTTLERPEMGNTHSFPNKTVVNGDLAKTYLFLCALRAHLLSYSWFSFYTWLNFNFSKILANIQKFHKISVSDSFHCAEMGDRNKVQTTQIWIISLQIIMVYL